MRKPKPWSETSPSQRRQNGRQLTIYLRPEEYDTALRLATEAGLSLSQFVAASVRNASPQMHEASQMANRAVLVKIENLEREVARLRLENAKLIRSAQPEVRIGQRGTTGDIYFSLPEYVVVEVAEWGRAEVGCLEREMGRTVTTSRKAAIPKELGRVQAILDIFEAMVDQYRTRRKPSAV